jgi:phosphoglycolate phosphatase-like HAD superfamily hydrolase
LRAGPTALLAQRADASAIVSNNMSGTIEAFLRSAGLPRIPYRTRDLVNRPKPARDGLDDLRALWAGRPAVVIGDAEIDARLAAAAGLQFIHVDDLDGFPCASS